MITETLIYKAQNKNSYHIHMWFVKWYPGINLSVHVYTHFVNDNFMSKGSETKKVCHREHSQIWLSCMVHSKYAIGITNIKLTKTFNKRLL